LGIFILSLALTLVIRWSLRFILFAFVQKTKTELDDIVIRSVKNVATYSRWTTFCKRPSLRCCS